MSALSDGEAAILGKLADTSQQQAVTGERLAGVLERLETQLVHMDEDRIRALAELKLHITTTMATVSSDARANDRKLAMFCTLLVIVAQIARASLDHLLPAVQH